MKLEDLPIYPFVKSDLHNYKILKLKKGEYLERATMDSGYIYYVINGAVFQEAVSNRGNNLLLNAVTSGYFAGHISKLRGICFLCDAIAGTDCEVLAIPRERLKLMLSDLAFSEFFYRTTSERVYYAYKRLIIQKMYSVEEVLAYYILENAEDEVFVHKSMYKLCAELSVSRRGLYNTIYALTRKGYLKKKGNVFLITNRQALEEIAESVRSHYECDGYCLIGM